MRRYGDEVIREPVLLRLSPGRSPPQGALLELTGEIRRPRGPSDGFDERTWLRRHGVHVVVHASRWRIVGRRGGLSGFADGRRARLARSMAPGLGGERRAVIAGIVRGEDEGLSESLRERFRASGLYHLLAVSGQNVALIAGGALLFAYLIGASRVLGEIFALGAIGSYVLAVGWQPSVVRAGIAGALASLAWLAARPRDRWYFLLLGAAVLLAWNPYSLLDAGFQLSFAAVAAIFVVVPRLESSLAGYPLPRSLAEVVAVSAACGVATARSCSPSSGRFRSIRSRQMRSPSRSSLRCWDRPRDGAHRTGSAATCRRSRLGQRLAGGIPRRLRASRRRPSVRGGLRSNRAGCRGHRSRRCLAHRAAAPASGASRRGADSPRAPVAGGWRLRGDSSSLPPPLGLRITFLDVGQGDGVLLQVPGGAVLIDEGPPEADVAGQLRRLGVRRLSLVVLTIRSAITWAAPPRCSTSCLPASRSIRAFPAEAPSSTLRSPLHAVVTCASWRRAPDRAIASERFTLGFCGRTAQGRQATIRTTTRS